jgi:tRNA threonylcarbamoyladenosine biosynthesis protein TsaB
MMRIVAIETTDQTGSVAIAEDGNVLLELELDRRLRGAQSLAPTLQDVLKRGGWQPNDVQLVAVTVGPGSFTGLRVGVTTAKVFAYTVGAEVLGVNTLEAIAAAAPREIAALWTAIDAQRGEVVVRSFVRNAADGWLRPVGQQELLPIDVWLSRLVPGDRVAGPILAKLADRLPRGVAALPPAAWAPRAGQVARLAARDYAAGRRDDLWGLVPAYARCSAAEEKWLQKSGHD